MQFETRPKCTVLVVEDEVLISLALQMVLEEAGFEVIGLATTVDEALNSLTKARPDVATLDLSLAGQIATPVARALLDLKVPFVVLSAHSSYGASFDPIFATVPRLQKPMDDMLLVKTLNEMLVTAALDAPGSHMASNFLPNAKLPSS